MTDRPLFGDGSARTTRQKQRTKFLRHNEVVNNRLPDVVPVAKPVPTQPTPHAQTQVGSAQPVPTQPVPAAIAQSPVANAASAAATPLPGAQGNVNNRKQTRMRTLKGGIIMVPGQMMATFGCKIRNESSGGAMLQVSAHALLPSEFYLVRDSDPGHKMPCKVAWRTPDRIGIMFINQLSSETNEPIG